MNGQTEQREPQRTAPWPADLAEALDLAVAHFDADWQLLAVNARWVQRYGIAAGSLDEVAARMLAAADGTVPDRLALDGLRKAMRLYARDAEVPLPDGTTVLMTASPVASGGAIVTTRDLQRDRLSEEAALRLLCDGLASADMGMLLWDAGLVVRSTNRAWGRLATPAADGDLVRDVLGRLDLRGPGLSGAPPAAGAGIDRIVAEMHRAPRQWSVVLPGERRTRLQTFPTRSGGVLATAYDATALREAEERAQELLADAIDSFDIGIVLVDESLRSRYMNRALVELVFDPEKPPAIGMTVAELAGIALQSGILRAPEGMSDDALKEMLVDAVLSSRDDIVLRRTDGGVLECVCFRTRMGGYVVVVRDVTARMAAEAAAREANEKTRTIVETLGEGVALYDRDGRLLMNNPAFRRVVMRDQPLSRPGDTIEDEVRANIAAGNIPAPPGEEDAVVAWILGCIMNHELDVELPMAGGRTLEASNYGTPDGGYLIQMRDVTQRKKAERAAREADALVRTVIDSSPMPILVSRLKDGEILFRSSAFRDLFPGLESTLHFFEKREERDIFVDRLRRERRQDEFATRLICGKDRTMEALISARLVEYGDDTLVVSAIRDVTEVLAMQAELERQREVAHQAEKMSALGELLAGVAHELNNPLSIIVAHAMMLSKDAADGPVRTRATKIAAAAERSGRIVRSFLAIARRRPARMEPCSVNEIVETALEISTFGIEKSGAEVRLDLSEGLPAIAADADQMVQVVSNLIVNAGYAIRGRGAEGRLGIRTAGSASGGVVIEVTDNGPGIPADIRSRIFEPFFTTKDVGSGTGIGLAFCHRVVTAHGGEIGLGDGSGGTCFSITLPATSEPETRPADPVRQPTPGRVLVVDDEPQVCEVLVEMLKASGFDATGVSSGAAALDLMARTAFDAVLSDIRMPDMDGFQFLARLRQVSPDAALRTGFVTGDGPTPRAAADLPEVATIAKPVNPRELAAFVTRLMGGA